MCPPSGPLTSPSIHAQPVSQAGHSPRGSWLTKQHWPWTSARGSGFSGPCSVPIPPLSRCAHTAPLAGFHPQPQAGPLHRTCAAATSTQTFTQPHPGEPDRLAHTLLHSALPHPQPSLRPSLAGWQLPRPCSTYSKIWATHGVLKVLRAHVCHVLGRSNSRINTGLCVWCRHQGVQALERPFTLHTAASPRGLTGLTGTERAPEGARSTPCPRVSSPT